MVTTTWQVITEKTITSHDTTIVVFTRETTISQQCVSVHTVYNNTIQHNTIIIQRHEVNTAKVLEGKVPTQTRQYLQTQEGIVGRTEGPMHNPYP